MRQSNHSETTGVSSLARPDIAGNIPGGDFGRLLKRTEKAILALERAADSVEAEFKRSEEETRPSMSASDVRLVLTVDGKRREVNLADVVATGGIPTPFQILGDLRDSRRIFLRVSDTARRDVRRLSLLLGKVRKEQSKRAAGGAV